MATVTYFTDNVPVTADLSHRTVKVERQIDFTLNPATTSSDTIDLLNIPAGAHVRSVGVLVITAEGTTETMQVGDSAGATRWMASGTGGAVNLNSAGSIRLSTPADYYPALGGKLYTTDSLITGLLATNAAAVAKITVWATYSIVANLT